MKDIEKLFADGLQHHRVAPPPAPWDRMAEVLQQRRRRRRKWYGTVAAAVLLLGATVGTVVWTYSPDPTPTVSQSSDTSQEDRRDAVAGSASPTDQEKGNARPSGWPLVPSPNRRAPVGAPRSAERTTTQRALDRKDDKSSDLPKAISPAPPERSLTVPPALAEVEAVPSESRPPAGNDISPSASPTRVVDAARYRIAAADTAKATSERPPDVTVVYRPNPSTLAKKPSLGRKVAQTLTHIKRQGIGFSELRSAKDHLVDKVFSEKDEQRE